MSLIKLLENKEFREIIDEITLGKYQFRNNYQYEWSPFSEDYLVLAEKS